MKSSNLYTDWYILYTLSNDSIADVVTKPQCLYNMNIPIDYVSPGFQQNNAVTAIKTDSDITKDNRNYCRKRKPFKIEYDIINLQNLW